MLLQSFNSATGVYMFVYILTNMLINLRIHREREREEREREEREI
jgi:hypothetical protein